MGVATQAEEQADPSAADAAYNTATSAIRNQARDARFALLHKENANYGFRRNLLGLRLWGIAASLGVAGAAVVIALVTDGSLGQRAGAAATPVLYAAASLIGFLLLLGTGRGFRRRRIRDLL